MTVVGSSKGATEDFPYSVRFREQEWGAAEFVAENLQWVLRKAICEAVEGFVERGFKGFRVFIGGVGAGDGGVIVVEVC